MADNYISAKSVSRKTIVSRQWNTMVLLGIPCHGPDTNFTLGAVVEGRASRFVSVLSRVPLGPVLVFAFTHDLPHNVKSQIRLFADDCLLHYVCRAYVLYSPSCDVSDNVALQRDTPVPWSEAWGCFNAQKCNII